MVVVESAIHIYMVYICTPFILPAQILEDNVHLSHVYRDLCQWILDKHIMTANIQINPIDLGRGFV